MSLERQSVRALHLWRLIPLVGGCAEEPAVGRVEAIVNADGEDETEPFLFPSVVYVESNNCTGTLISPSHVLTAAHCVDGVGTLRIPPTQIALRGLPTGPEDRVAVVRCELDARYWGDSEAGPGHSLDECRRPDRIRGTPPENERAAFDVAILTLARPVPHPVPDPTATTTPRAARPAQLSTAAPVASFPAIAVGRGATEWATGTGGGPRRYVRFTTLWSAPIMREVPSPLGPGDSGGALFREDGPTGLELVGVASEIEPPFVSGRPYTAFWSAIDAARVAWIDERLDRNADGRPDNLCASDRGADLSADGANDTDGDYVLDIEDTCPGVFNPCQRTTDADRDGIDDDCEHCPADATHSVSLSSPLPDADRDGVANDCDCSTLPNLDDTDGDLIRNGCDICEDDADTSQADCDDDGVGDACSIDRDLDNAIDVCGFDNCVGVANFSQANCNEDAERANDRPVLGDACDPTPCGETHLTFRVARRGSLVVEVPGRVRVDARASRPGVPALLSQTGERYCRCAGGTSDEITARTTCDPTCPIARAATVAGLYQDIEGAAQPWRDVTLDYPAADSTPPTLVPGAPSHPSDALLAYDHVGSPFEFYDVDAEADWRLRETDVPRWATFAPLEPRTGPIPGVMWTHSATGAAPALRSHYWSGVMPEERVLLDFGGAGCAALAQPVPRLRCIAGDCITAALPDPLWLVEGGFYDRVCTGRGTGIADFFLAIGPGGVAAAAAFPSVPAFAARDVSWVSLSEPVELIPAAADLRLVAVSLDGARVLDQLIESPIGFVPRGFFGECPGGPNCPPPAPSCDNPLGCRFFADGSAAAPLARAAAAPEVRRLFVLSASRSELFVIETAGVRVIDLLLGGRRTLDLGEETLGTPLAATYDVLRNRLYVIDEVTGRGRHTRARLVEIDPDPQPLLADEDEDGHSSRGRDDRDPADVLGHWPRGAGTTRFALTAARDGNLYLVASGERGSHALVALMPSGEHVRVTGISLGEGPLSFPRVYASDTSISYVVERGGTIEVVYARPEEAVWRGRSPIAHCF